MKRNKKPKYTKLYPDVFLGVGAGMPHHWGNFKVSFLFRRHWWISVRYEIIEMFRRAYRGYDDSMWWGMNSHLPLLYIRLLLELAERTSSVPNFNGNDDLDNVEFMSDEEAGKVVEDASKKWKKHLAEIAEHFYESLDGRKCIHEVNQYEIEEYKKEQFKIGMEKMLKVWNHLWD